MRINRLLILVISIITLFAFTTSCLAATATTTKKTTTKKVTTPVKKPVVKKPAVKPVAKPAVKPAVKPAAPVVIPVPAGFTGDKAAAFKLLAKGKYSGKASGDFTAELKNIVLLGDRTMTLSTKSTGVKTLAASKDVPALAGGDFKDKAEAKVPFIELAGGDAKAIEAFLKEAKEVKVAGTTITITNAKPPVSVLGIMNSVTSKVKWMKNRLSMETITVTTGATGVTSIEFVLKGTADGSNDMPANVKGKITY